MESVSVREHHAADGVDAGEGEFSLEGGLASEVGDALPVGQLDGAQGCQHRFDGLEGCSTGEAEVIEGVERCAAIAADRLARVSGNGRARRGGDGLQRIAGGWVAHQAVHDITLVLGDVYTGHVGEYHEWMRWLHVLIVAATLATAGVAWAEIPQNPGAPRAPGMLIVYGSYIALTLCVVLVGTAAFKPAKRTHQD